MKPMRAVRKSALLLLAIGAVATLTGSAAQAAAESVLFLRAPSIALQGKALTVVAAAKPAGDVCTLRVRYADGAVQTIGRAPALRGRASWTWKVPDVAKPGRGTLTASCPRAGRRARSVTVVGNLVPPTIVVANEGFSVRPKTTGSSVSYGLLLKNLSPNADALRVYVLVNLVMADGHVLGTATRTVEAIAAGTTYAYGGSLNFPGAAPIVQLEIVIKVDGRQRHSLRTPVVDNVRVLPGRSDAAWVGEVNGEVINDHPSLNLRSTNLSAVVFDPEGNIIGGGTGSAGALLPPGTRQAFVMRSGFDAIPWPRAAYARVSPLGTYVP